MGCKQGCKQTNFSARSQAREPVTSGGVQRFTSGPLVRSQGHALTSVQGIAPPELYVSKALSRESKMYTYHECLVEISSPGWDFPVKPTAATSVVANFLFFFKCILLTGHGRPYSHM